MMQKWIHVWLCHDVFELFNVWNCIREVPDKHGCIHLQQVWTTQNVQHGSHFLIFSAPYSAIARLFRDLFVLVHLSLNFFNKFRIIIFVGKCLVWNLQPHWAKEHKMKFWNDHPRWRSSVLKTALRLKNGVTVLCRWVEWN